MNDLHRLYQAIAGELIDEDQRELMPPREDRLAKLLSHIRDQHTVDLEELANQTDTIPPQPEPAPPEVGPPPPPDPIDDTDSES